MEKDNKLIEDLSDKAISSSKDLFSYLKEPYDRAADSLIKAFVDHNSINEGDIDLVAVNLLARKWVRKIKRNKEIMDKANEQFNVLLKYYKNKSPNSININKPDDEWLDYFFEMSSMINDSSFQEIWAHLLMREHIEPGNVTKVMLNKLAMLDSKSAETFTKLCQLTYELILENEDECETSYIPLVVYENDFKEHYYTNEDFRNTLHKYMEYCPTDDELEFLSEVGLIKFNSKGENFIYFFDDIDANFSCDKGSIIIKGTYNEADRDYQVTTGYVFFTQIGLSLYRMLKNHYEEYEDLWIVLNNFVKSQDPDNKFLSV